VIDIGYVSGASKVRWEDQEKLRKQIEADQPRAKAKSKSELKKEDALRDENEALWAIKDKLRAALDVGQLKYMLEHNKQDSKVRITHDTRHTTHATHTTHAGVRACMALRNDKNVMWCQCVRAGRRGEAVGSVRRGNAVRRAAAVSVMRRGPARVRARR
jgi:hypothetical protein